MLRAILKVACRSASQRGKKRRKPTGRTWKDDAGWSNRMCVCVCVCIRLLPGDSVRSTLFLFSRHSWGFGIVSVIPPLPRRQNPVVLDNAVDCCVKRMRML
ncbi:uncharacterized protein LY79DRAFT_532315, partial [Colletotrichum navitas]